MFKIYTLGDPMDFPRSYPHISSGSTRKTAATRLRKSLVTRMTRSTTEVSLLMLNLDPNTFFGGAWSCLRTRGTLW